MNIFDIRVFLKKSIFSRDGVIRRACVAAALAAAMLGLAVSPSFAQTASVTEPSRLMLSQTGDPRATMTVTWQAPEGAATGVARCGVTRERADAIEVRAAAAPSASGIDTGGKRFTATFSNLKPGTLYYYSVENDGRRSGTASFRTAEADTEPFSFLYMGDIQITKSAETDFGAWGAFARDAAARHPEAAFALQGGDIVESGISPGEWGAFLDNASPVFSHIPFMPTNGNHESNFLSGKPELYLDVFTLPENGPAGFKEEFYSFDYGDAHFIVLNSWALSGEQKLGTTDLAALDAWIERDLADSDAKWKIALTHVPLYALHSDLTANAARARWAGLLERGGARVLFVGHQHVYSRLRPLTNGVFDPSGGIVQIMGNAGLKFYSAADESLAERTVYDVSSYCLVRVDEEALTVQTFDGSGREIDFAVLASRVKRTFLWNEIFCRLTGETNPFTRTAARNG